MYKFRVGDLVTTHEFLDQPAQHRTVVVPESGPNGRICIRKADGNLTLASEYDLVLVPPTLAQCIRSLDVAVKCGAGRGQYEVLVRDLIAAHARENT